MIWNELTGGIFELRDSSRKIRQKIDCLKKNEPEVVYQDSLGTTVPKSVLLGYLEQEQARRRVIEEKAKTNVLAITIAFSAMIASIAVSSKVAGIADGGAGWMVWPVIALHIIGIVFLLAGGLVALNALLAVPTYMWTLGLEKRNLTTEAISVKVSWSLEINQLVTLIKSNQVDTSYRCIRNGVIVLALAAILFVVIFAVPVDLGGKRQVEVESKTISSPTVTP